MPSVGHVYALRLKKLGIETVKDLLFHVPSRYLDFSKIQKVKDAEVGERVTLMGQINSLKNQYSKRGLKMQIGRFEDETGKLSVVWFNQPFLIKSLYPGRRVSLSGKIGFFGMQKALISPEYEILGKKTATTHTGRLVPIYPETKGVSSKWLRGKIKKAIDLTQDDLKDPLAKEILEKNDFPTLAQAIKDVHFPKSIELAQKARRRLAFDELLNIQSRSLLRKKNWQKIKTAFKLTIDKKAIEGFIDNLPFKLTTSQDKVLDEILKDLAKPYPMNRLLQGDVGSGKTVVAAIATFVAFTNGYQSAIMAPTQILAQQHCETFRALFKKYKVRISLITSSIKHNDIGKADIFIGTHSLIQKKVDLSNVVLVVIDEQHRFGVEQRALLVKKSKTPNILTMTATPIPRTVALTAYGDLDLSTLRQLPKGRQKITTWIVPKTKRKNAYLWLEKEIKKEKSQAFVICPLIEESEKEGMQEVKAVTAEFENLKSILTGSKIDMLHGRLKADQKNQVIDNFKKGKTDILVSTPVVEVGIDIPNASIMVIEGAERFGLAQLHQLRGRVGRGKKKSYCLLFGKSKRLTYLTKNLSGFELAEIDLKLRGPGEVFGKLQHGFIDLKIASWSDFDLIKKAKEVAQDLLINFSYLQVDISKS